MEREGVSMLAYEEEESEVDWEGVSKPAVEKEESDILRRY